MAVLLAAVELRRVTPTVYYGPGALTDAAHAFDAALGAYSAALGCDSVASESAEDESPLQASLKNASQKVAESPPWLRSIYDHNRAIAEQLRAEQAPKRRK